MKTSYENNSPWFNTSVVNNEYLDILREVI